MVLKAVDVYILSRISSASTLTAGQQFIHVHFMLYYSSGWPSQLLTDMSLSYSSFQSL
jgi:hypothetical protein